MVSWSLGQLIECIRCDDDHQMIIGLESGAAVGAKDTFGALNLDNECAAWQGDFDDALTDEWRLIWDSCLDDLTTDADVGCIGMW